jgi:hypothetical protein
MFRRQPTAPVRTIDLGRHDVDPLKHEADPDPLIEAAAQRLREQLSALTATDEWGRPVPWRHVARIALGPLVTPRVRDAVTSDVLADAVTEEVAPEPARSVSPEGEAEWRSFFRAIDEGDRLLDQRALPEG